MEDAEHALPDVVESGPLIVRRIILRWQTRADEGQRQTETQKMNFGKVEHEGGEGDVEKECPAAQPFPRLFLRLREETSQPESLNRKGQKKHEKKKSCKPNNIITFLFFKKIVFI